MQSIINSTSGTIIDGAVARTVDTSKGGSNSRLSSQWCTRPDDQKFLDLASLEAHVKRAADESFADIVDTKDIQVRARLDDPESLKLLVPSAKRGDVVVEPNHWAFGQLCSLVRVPAGYLRELPAGIAGINLQHGLLHRRNET